MLSCATLPVYMEAEQKLVTTGSRRRRNVVEVAVSSHTESARTLPSYQRLTVQQEKQESFHTLPPGRQGVPQKGRAIQNGRRLFLGGDTEKGFIMAFLTRGRVQASEKLRSPSVEKKGQGALEASDVPCPLVCPPSLGSDRASGPALATRTWKR